MCGRFTLHSRLNLLLRQFAIDTGPEMTPRYNIAPTQNVPVVRCQAGEGRELALLRWGLVPSWAKDPSIGNRMINARAETVATKPSYRAAFKRRRCLVPADGYYEWKKTGKAKQPYLIRLQDECPFAMAGLWESWQDAGGAALQTFTIITTEANEATCDIHNRMPVILSPGEYPLWLDPEFERAEQLQELLQPYDSHAMRLDPVSTFVNNPRHDSSECIEVRKS